MNSLVAALQKDLNEFMTDNWTFWLLGQRPFRQVPAFNLNKRGQFPFRFPCNTTTPFLCTLPSVQ